MTDLHVQSTCSAELLAFLERILPTGWKDAVVAGDSGTVLGLRATIDRRAVVAALGREGWITPHWAAAYGGRGLSLDEAQQVADILDEWDVPRMPHGSGLMLAAPAILEWASEDTKRRFLPRIATGEDRWCQLFSEPAAGSDLASLATTAERDGDGWVVNGQKVWTTLGHRSEFGMLLARTDPNSPKHRGITYFGVDMRTTGVEVRPLRNIAGQVEFNEVFLNDVRIPDLDRISPVGKGWEAALTTLAVERQALSGVRNKRKASDEILGGKTVDDVLALARAMNLAAEPIWRDRLVREWCRQRILQLTSIRTKTNSLVGRPGPEGSISKVAKAVANQSLQEVAMDLLGVQATAWSSTDADTPSFVTQFLRTRANSIEGGTSEIQRNIIGERVLGLPSEPNPYRGMAWRDVPRS